MAPSNVHRYLASFAQSGLLRQDPTTSLYDLGPLALQVGLTALNRLNTVEFADPEMRRLAGHHRIMALLSVFSLHGPTVVRVQQCSPPIISSVTLGSLLPMRSATGRAFLAFLPREVTEHVLATEFPSDSPRSAAQKMLKEMRNSVPHIRRSLVVGVGIDVLPGLYAVASPILNHQGEASAVISITSADAGLQREDHPAVLDLVSTARRLSAAAGFKGSPHA